MEDKKQEKKLTGPGTVGGSRPGEGGMQRVPPPSLSDNRREEQVPGQACFFHRSSAPVEEWVRSSRGGVVASIYDSSEDSLSWEGDRAKRRKRALPPSATVAPEKEASSDAVLVHCLLDVADSLGRLAVSADRYGDAYEKCLWDNSTKVRDSAVELAKRLDIAAAMSALERENSLLKERLLKVEQEMASLRLHSREVSQEKDIIYINSKPPLAAPRGKARSVIEQGKSFQDRAMEVEALAEKLQVLGEPEPSPLRADRPTGSNEPIRLEKTDPKRRVPVQVSEGRTAGPKLSAQKKKERDQHTAESRTCSTPKTDPATTWVEVVGRKEKAAAKKAETEKSRKDTATRARRERDPRPTPKGMRSGGKPNIHPPRRAAVAISLATGSTKTCGEVLATARAQIPLSEIGGPVARIRQTAAGGILFEIPGRDGSAKADILAARLGEVFAKEEEVRISRPIKRAEVRIRGLDISIQPGDVEKAVVAVGGCDAAEVKVGEIRRRSPRGMGTAWVQCPSPVAKVLVDQGKVVIGWVTARVEALKARPMTCFRCLRTGHAAGSCTSTKDRSSNCYNCGGEGHRARECRAPPKCLVCLDAGRASNHRTGSGDCKPVGAR